MTEGDDDGSVNLSPTWGPSGIGATLSRGDYFDYDAYATGQSVYSAEQDIHGDLRSIGVQASNQPPRHPTVQTSIIADDLDLPTDSSLNTNTQFNEIWTGDDNFPEGMYQGEIHLGSLRPPAYRSNSGGGLVSTIPVHSSGPNANQYQSWQETHFTESREYHEEYGNGYDPHGEPMSIHYVE